MIDFFKRKLRGSRKKVATNVAWSIAGKIVNMAGALFVGILVARYLGPDQYGTMNYVISYVMIFQIFAAFGLDNIEVRELSKNSLKKNQILGTCFLLRLAFASIVFLVIMGTVVASSYDESMKSFIFVYSFSLYTSIFNVIRNYFTSILKNDLIVKTEIMRTIIGALIKILLLYYKATLFWFVFATFLDTFLIAGGYVTAYRKVVGSLKEWTFEKKMVAYLIKQSFPLLLSGAAIIIYQRIDQVMIGNMVNRKSVGFFATAGKFVDLILFLPNIVTQTVTPLLVKAKESGDIEGYERKKRDVTVFVLWFSIGLALLTAFLARVLIEYTYGLSYMEAVPILRILSWKTVGMSLMASSGCIIIIEEMQKWAFIRNIMGCFVCIVLNMIFIPKYGAVGSACVTLATVFVSGYFAHLLIPKYRKIFKLQTYAFFVGWMDLMRLIKR